MPITSRNYRYRLPEKAIKLDCPDCSPKHRKTLSRYVDIRTGEPLPESYGRCDRETNCGYHFSPYHKGPSGMSYADEVYERWKEENPKIARATARRHRHAHTPTRNTLKTRLPSGQESGRCTSSPPSTNQPIHSIPDELFTKSLGHYDRNQFARLLIRHFGANVADELLQRFQIGTSSRWPGACIFWYIDEHGRKRGGQIKLFDETFHTIKYENSEGKKCSKISWVHSSYAYQLSQRQQPHPDWLTNYINQHDFSPCLFGLPQLLTEQADKPVGVVESPKIAVLCTTYFPQLVWVAVGALSYLDAGRLAPLLGRTIVLFPDASVRGKDSDRGKDFNNWQRKATALASPDGQHQPAFQIQVSDFLEERVTDEDRVKGLDLADCLLNSWKGYPPAWDEPTLPGAAPTLRITSLTDYLNQP